jgi:hypothetical protein
VRVHQTTRSSHSLVSELNDPRIIGSIAGVREKILVLVAASRTSVGTTQPPSQWLQGSFYRGGKQPGREAGYSPSTTVGVKNSAVPPLPPHVSISCFLIV